MGIKSLIYTFIFLMTASAAFGQSSKQQKLEEERQRLRAEIQMMKELKKATRKRERSVLDEVESLNSQISTRENLIKVTSQQANLLTKEINDNQKRIGANRHQLKALKDDYAKMIVKAYKSKSGQSKIMFLLSSSNFTQAYKRLQYMRQYNEHRREQAEAIENKTVQLQRLNTALLEQKKIKQSLLEENEIEREKLQTHKLDQQVLMATIRKKQKKYSQEIKKKQAQADAIDKAIEKLIRAAIAKANKKAGKKVVKKGSSSTFALTPEETKLAAGFTSNKGKLPWPVGTGRLTKKFGRQPHPTIPNIMINPSGVEIETRPGERARAIFEGEVIAIQKLRGASKLVQIRHGNYITTYYNVDQIKVKEGQKVTTKQDIGVVRTNPKTGRAIMKFLIYQNATKLNPQRWIYRM